MPVAFFDISQTSAYILSYSPAILPLSPRAFIYLDVSLLAPLSLNTLPFKHSFLSLLFLLITLVQQL